MKPTTEHPALVALTAEQRRIVREIAALQRASNDPRPVPVEELETRTRRAS
jgi:hypothetical protein